MRESFAVYLKGFMMGAADTVPGVSGGTIALITGIYERLIEAITAFDPRDLQHVLRVHEESGRAALRELFYRVDAPFLLVLGLGIATAVITLSRVLHAAIQQYPALVAAFFFGLIAASAVVLYQEVDVSTPRRLLVGAAGVIIAAGVTMIPSNALGHSTPVVFVSGAIAVSAMVLPGVSGSFFLVILQQYEYMTGTLKRFVDGLLSLASGGDFGPVAESGVVVVTFCTGMALGLLSMSRIIDWALDNYREATLTFLVSLMVGGLRLPLVDILDEGDLSSGESMAAIVGIALIGGVLVLGVDYVTEDFEYA
ncbi:DUF368 domain-containing protein [Haloarchaeobius sp. HME9146]|uniref:DUF368 domain-containing protein n=1 Tax=Haloarchaeobius sp. HME9146 TaxID=2978732 RepID=UPI0021BF23DD|nr:DUF368 domain-containing protein [Haloarchaeobius sp. HME9146]MCT9097019.1 DUF368 domain-containing protein [Haloarchaeobius sp. HME9146]